MTGAKTLLTLDQAARYEIVVVGRLNPDWSEAFCGMQMASETAEDGRAMTRLSGVLADQAALHGLLRTIRDLGLPLLKVEFIPEPII